MPESGGVTGDSNRRVPLHNRTGPGRRREGALDGQVQVRAEHVRDHLC